MPVRSPLPPHFPVAMFSHDEARSRMNSGASAPVDFDTLMQAHLTRVFGERDPGRRLEALRELYCEDATLFEPHAAVTGHEGISNAVDALQAGMPPDFVFTASGVTVGHHGLARLQWRVGPPGGPAAATGTDVARVENGRIQALYVFIDPTPP